MTYLCCSFIQNKMIRTSYPCMNWVRIMMLVAIIVGAICILQACDNYSHFLTPKKKCCTSLVYISIFIVKKDKLFHFYWGYKGISTLLSFPNISNASGQIVWTPEAFVPEEKNKKCEVSGHILTCSLYTLCLYSSFRHGIGLFATLVRIRGMRSPARWHTPMIPAI